MKSVAELQLEIQEIFSISHSGHQEGMQLMSAGNYMSAIEKLTKAITNIIELFSANPELNEIKLNGNRITTLGVVPSLLALRGAAYYKLGSKDNDNNAMQLAQEDFDRATKFPTDCYPEGILEQNMQFRAMIIKEMNTREAPEKGQKTQKKWWEIWK